VNEEGCDGDVKMEPRPDSEQPAAGTEVSRNHDVDDGDLAIDNGEPRSPPKSPAKRSNSEMQAEEEDDEPVRKRSRRNDRGGKMQPPKRQNVATGVQEEPSKAKATASEAGKRKADRIDSSPKAKTSKKPKGSASAGDEDSKKKKHLSGKKKAFLAEDVKIEHNEPADESNVEPEDDLMDASDEEDAEKARKETQSILKTRSSDPYPDWKPGEPVPYAALCTTFALIEMTSKRLAIMAHCTLFLRQVLRLTPQDLLPTVQLMINKIAADYTGIELGIGEQLIMKAIGESTGRSLDVVKADNKSIGDLGLVAVKSRSTQRTLYKPKPLTVRGVLDGLMIIATTSGDGSQAMKISGIKKLLSAADSANAGKTNKGIDITNDKGGASESKFIIRFLEGKLRLGLAERTVLISLAHAMVAHEEGQKSNKPPSSDKLSQGTETLKTVYRLSNEMLKFCLFADRSLANCQTTLSSFLQWLNTVFSSCENIASCNPVYP
jgi:DNA ligase-1